MWTGTLCAVDNLYVARWFCGHTGYEGLSESALSIVPWTCSDTRPAGDCGYLTDPKRVNAIVSPASADPFVKFPWLPRTLVVLWQRRRARGTGLRASQPLATALVWRCE